jgi:hypothetical protein
MFRRTPALARAAIAALAVAVAGGPAACKGKGNDLPPGAGSGPAPAATAAAPTKPPAGAPAAAIPGAATAAAAPATPASPEIHLTPPSYPDSVQGLENLMDGLVQAIEDDSSTEMERLLRSLQLPQPDAWFRGHFDGPTADKLLKEYQPVHDGIGHLQRNLKQLIDGGQNQVHAERYDKPDDPAEVGYQSKALAKMKTPTALYSVRITTPDGKRVFHVWSFVHDQGTFRFVGKMRAAADVPPPPAAGRDPLEFRLRDAARVKAMNGK